MNASSNIVEVDLWDGDIIRFRQRLSREERVKLIGLYAELNEPALDPKRAIDIACQFFEMVTEPKKFSREWFSKKLGKITPEKRKALIMGYLQKLDEQVKSGSVQRR
jgi:hypothetical protein